MNEISTADDRQHPRQLDKQRQGPARQHSMIHSNCEHTAAEQVDRVTGTDETHNTPSIFTDSHDAQQSLVCTFAPLVKWLGDLFDEEIVRVRFSITALRMTVVRRAVLEGLW